MKSNHGNFASTLAMPWLGVCLLAGTAIVAYAGRDYALIAIMFFWPFLDRRWSAPAPPRGAAHYASWAILFVTGAILVMWHPEQTKFTLLTLATAALPEEWFFRAYFMTRLGRGWRANVLASLVFSLLHGLTGDWLAAVLVVAPSLFYGWLYQRTRDLPLLVLAHALSNLVFALFLARPLSAWFGYLLGYQG